MKERNARVLLVEDEPVTRLSVAEVLRRAGMNVQQTSPADASAALQSRHHDLLVLDVAAPDRWELLEKMHDQPRLPPVLVLSAHGTDARARPFRECVAAYLFRPVSEGEILGTCERILALAARSEAFRVERRRSRRRRLMARVTLGAVEGEGVAGTLVDVSESGFQAELAAAAMVPEAMGELVRLRVLTSAEAPTLTGRIRWWHAIPTGCLFGAELDEGNEGNARALSQLLPL